jgi:hypothetical protein
MKHLRKAGTKDLTINLSRLDLGGFGGMNEL